VEEREAQRLLELGIPLHLHVSTLPVALQRLALRLREPVEALRQSTFETRVHLVP
jgi:hypothetical protein